MNRARHLLLWAWLAGLPVCCAPGDSDAPKPAAGHLSLSQRLEQKNGYKQDAKGNWVPQTDQRSSFETKGESPYFQGQYGKQEGFETQTFAKKPWWGGKDDYGRETFAHNTDGSRLVKSSRFNQQGARESGGAADLPGTYRTDNFATRSARETQRNRLAKPSDTETDIRRQVFPAPEIVDWRQQRSLSLEQSKGILGR